ncbi:MAG: AraC family transcriptional regulator [Pseudomonadota bacterium]
MSDTTSFQNSVLATLLLPVAQTLRLQGFDALQLFEDQGIDMAKAANPDWRVPHRQFIQLLQSSAEATGDEAFGLAASENLQPQVLQGLGLAWLSSDTVLQGLQRLVRFCRFVNTGANLQLEEVEDRVHLRMLGKTPVGLPPGYGRDYGVGIVNRMCELTLGEFLAPLCVDLERAPPANPERWEYLLSSRVNFAAEQTAITWSRADILEPLVTGDPVLARVNDEQTQTYLDGFLKASLGREVADKIIERLADGPPAQEDVAESLHMSARTLQRKLKEEGTSYKSLLNDTRLELARRYLGERRRSVVETAYSLGFSEPSTFSRAFKRWTGVSPAEYRDSGGSLQR